jgi:magnesium transporter
MRPTALEPLVRLVRLALGDGGETLNMAAAKDALSGLHPSEVAFVLDELALPEALAIFKLLDDLPAAEVLDEVSPETNRYLVENSPRERIIALLDILPMDDAAEVVSEVGAAEAGPLLAGLSRNDATNVTDLLTRAEDSAGRLMTGKFAAVHPHTTAGQVLDYLRRNAAELETINVVYVVNDGGRLVGVSSIRDVLTANADALVDSFMAREPIAVSPETDQQETARLMRQYDLLAIPVTEESGRIVGIVTIDDVIDVLVEEFNEDIAHFLGTDAEEMDRRTPAQVATLRLPWLMGTMVIELGAGLVIAHFESVLKQVILLASFMPVISAISGNVGLQAAAIIVRGLDTGHVSLTSWWRPLKKELVTSVIMSVVCGLVLGCIGAVWSRHLPFGVVIGAAMSCSMLTAGFMGTVIPMLSKRFGFDPATTAGPFETAFQDVIGFAVFLWLASLLVHWLK